MKNQNISIEKLQVYIDEVKNALKETVKAEEKILDLLAKKHLTDGEAHHVVDQLIQTTVWIEQLRANKKELIQIREDYFKGGSDGI